MGITTSFLRMLGMVPPESPEQPATTFVTGGGTDKERFVEGENRKLIPKYKNIYDRGGIVSQAIDCYPLYMLASGYRLESDDTAKAEEVRVFLDNIDFDGILQQVIVDALVVGDSYSELVMTKGGDVYNLVPRDGTTFSIQYDPYGTILNYTQSQKVNGKDYVVKLQPEQVVHVTLQRAAGNIYGVSLVAHAYDDILRDVTIVEGGAVALKRHAWPKYHVKIGTPDRQPKGVEMENAAAQFKHVDAKSEFVTSNDVAIDMLDPPGLGGDFSNYDSTSVTRLCAALGVPGELVNYRQGTTDNTANTRMSAFFKKIETYQDRLATQLNKQFIDKLAGQSGLVKLVFNSAVPDDEAAKIAWINTLLKVDATDPWAVITRSQVYNFMGWNIDDYKPEEMPDWVDPFEEQARKDEVAKVIMNAGDDKDETA